MKENVIFLYPYDKNINYVDHIPFIFYYDYKNELNLSKIFGQYKSLFFKQDYNLIKGIFIEGTLKSILTNQTISLKEMDPFFKHLGPIDFLIKFESRKMPFLYKGTFKKPLDLTHEHTIVKVIKRCGKVEKVIKREIRYNDYHIE